MLASLLLCLSAHASAETFATQPNNAGGKIVLTDEICKYEGKVYESLHRAYHYSSSGYNGEGCWFMEDETVVVSWIESRQKMRYPIENFTLSPKYKSPSTKKYKY
jgi:hypothetical protein